MITIESVSPFSGILSFTGNERAMREYIQKELKREKLSFETDPLGSLLIRKSENPIRKCLVVPLDTPGFLTVPHTDQETRFLLCGSQSAEDLPGESVFFEDGSFQIIRSKKKEDVKANDLFLSKAPFPVGTPCKIKAEIRSENGYITGRYASVYAVMRLAMDLAPSLPEDAAILFCAESFHPRAAFASNAAKRFGFQNAILVSSADSKEKSPLLAVRAGACFSDPEMIKTAETAAKKETIPFCKTLIDSDDLNAKEIAACGIPVLTFALPCRNKGKKNEEFLPEAAEQLKIILQKLL